jgi:hypothetical protein
MSKTFVEPDFRERDVELRFEGGVVCIYGTTQGLKKIADLCEWLIKDPNQGHIHIEEHRILTDRSEKGVIAIFKKGDPKGTTHGGTPGTASAGIRADR